LPALLLIAAAGALFWAWKTGRLRGFTYEDGVAAALLLLGLRLLTTGRVIPGAALVAGAAIWFVWRRGRKAKVPAMPVEEARRLLGVSEDATLADIRDAHRRLITKVHPDTGGSDELANQVNAARDSLVAEMNRRTPRAS
jgi:hypothetical protein